MQGPGPVGEAVPPQTGGYEFSAAENKTIGACALWARVLAVVFYVLGAIALIQCNVVTPILNAIIGTFLLLGGNALAAVVNTQGNDVANMMRALSKLRTAFAWRVWVTIVAVALVLIGLALFVLLFASFAERLQSS
jgi:hypothetical protein